MKSTLPPVLLLAGLLAGPAAAQTSAVGVRDLAFGVIPVGVTTVVLPTDPVKSGQWTLTSRIGNRIRFRITVPSQLNGPGGATMPVDFRNGDAFIQELSSGSPPDYFNPGGSVSFRFRNANTAIVRLGGRALPSPTQRSGSYTNTAILTIIVP